MKQIIYLLLFTTLVANAQEIILEEHFEEGETNPDWQVLDLDGDTFSFEIVYTSEVTDALGFEPGRMAGSFGIKFPLSGADPYSITPNDVLISPPILIGRGEFTYNLEYKVGTVVEDNNTNTYSVYLYPADQDFDTDTIEPIFTETLDGEPSARERDLVQSLDLEEEQYYRYAFRHHDSDGQFILLLDDILVYKNMDMKTKDIIQKDLLGIYPNPATNNISIKSHKKILQIQIYNALGQLVETIKGDLKNKELNSYTTGSYYMNFSFEDGSVTQKKLLVQK